MKTSVIRPAGKVIALAMLFVSSIGCQYPPAAKAAVNADKVAGKDSAVVKNEKDAAGVKELLADATTKPASASTIMARPQVPILCYHQIRNWRATDSKQAKDYIVPEAVFAEQIKMLADSGYHTISADQLYNYLSNGATLPTKPVMLTFDDTDLPQYTIAKPVMEKYGFKGLFFIMTVSLGRPNYMSKDQVKQLADAGNDIGSHTWDHKNIKKFTEADWAIQIDKPTKTLETITGKPVKYFAYPFGLWNAAVIPGLKQHGFQAAFQLSARREETEPLYTIRRIIVPGAWTAANLQSWIKHSF
ncbi:MAG: polysaccharide deacetylase family protein [Chitinophagaceae bacterium]